MSGFVWLRSRGRRQMRALGSDVGQVDHPVGPHFVLQVDVPLLHVAVAEVAGEIMLAWTTACPGWLRMSWMTFVPLLG